MKQLDMYWIWLSEIQEVGPVLQKRLLRKFGSAEQVYFADESQFRIIDGFGDTLIKRILSSRSLERAKRILEMVEKGKINLLTYDDSLYPEKIKSFAKSPILLYYKGELIKNSGGVGIIGTRRCTSYGKQVTVEAATYLATNNIPVVSGMAKGIDGYAHTVCLKEGGYTLAFLAHGLDQCYPKEHVGLMQKIIENGAVLSRYPPKTPIHPKHFLERNFLIAAWSSKLLVVEAGEKSGALTTSQFAKQLGKEVLAVPNHIYCPESIGTNTLIAQGSPIYLSPQQLFSPTSLSSKKTLFKDKPSTTKRDHKNPLSREPQFKVPLEQSILSILSIAPMDIENLANYLEKDPSEILELLSVMELEGVIEIQSGNFVKLI